MPGPLRDRLDPLARFRLELLNLVLSITLDTTLRVKYKMVNFVVDNYDIELEECGLQFNSISIGSQGG